MEEAVVPANAGIHFDLDVIPAKAGIQDLVFFLGGILLGPKQSPGVSRGQTTRYL